MNYQPDFKEGDIITFCDEEFVVLQNRGDRGTVKENCQGGGTITNWHWEYHGERCQRKEEAT